MLKKRPNLGLPLTLKTAKLSSRIALGMVFLSFLLGLQPNLGFPPVKAHVDIAAAQEQQQTVKAQALPFQFRLPFQGYLSTHFSYYHPGIDLASGLGMPVKPIAPGTVVEEGYNFWGLGLTIVIDHGQGYQSLYAHLGKIYVKKGDHVDYDNYIGEIGLTGHTTGPHTHLEVSRDGVKIDPLSILPAVRDYPQAQDFENKQAYQAPSGNGFVKQAYAKESTTQETAAKEPKKEDTAKQLLENLNIPQKPTPLAPLQSLLGPI